MLICRNSGSGKTNLLYHILMKPLVYYDQIHLYGKNLEQEKYRHMIETLNDISRHKNCSVIYLSQSFYKTPKDIRLNCSHYVVYDFPSSNERNMISRELNVTEDQYIKVTKQPYSFLYVDKPMKTVKRNFYGNI
ncbi:unnamed protein product [Porites evermanni]|uniref:Uncharacterized protein n=1 Tax=Porites evermanni TaxID=104178 RepID=A0ABN8PKI5_9CNID|nr:unnamed protein product [Porites evermanni]